MVKFSTLESICKGTIVKLTRDRKITHLIIDSRKSIVTDGALFFAMAGQRHDAHQFIPDLYNSGFRQFVIEKPMDIGAFPEGNFVKVNSSLEALQAVARVHREEYSIPVIGITGSNGKTIVKEWLYQLLSPDLNVVKNPGSYNSQVGVPLSVWQIQAHHQLGIFEAGISTAGEMSRLQKVIQPTLGIFTTIGPAHAEGFASDADKIREKLELFESSNGVIYNCDQADVARAIQNNLKGRPDFLSWGAGSEAHIQIVKQGSSNYRISRGDRNFVLTFPFSDTASVENACHCIVLMLHLDYLPDVIQARLNQLKTIPMRLELKQGINHSQIIDDTYNNDLSGLQISLDFLAGLQKKKSTLILSDILQSGMADQELAKKISEIVSQSGVNSLIGVGPVIFSQKKFFDAIPVKFFFQSTDDFLKEFDWNTFQHEAILVKGARAFQFERIVQHLQRKIHGTVMEVDLGAMVHNLNFFRAQLTSGVKLMVMVKAFAYGSGSEEVANLLQYHNIDYLGVAYPDEGVELRKSQIRLPIMVMNPSVESFATMIIHRLEPEIYNPSLLRAFATFLNGAPGKIHIKIDTGMHRLGFAESEIAQAIAILRTNRNLEVVSVFSHLAGADEPAHDDFTREQMAKFLLLAGNFSRELNIEPVLHILNSSGILRFPEFQLGMVRLGIGLYGVDPTTDKNIGLKPVATLKTVISQIKKVNKGESIGYGRKGRAKGDIKTATLAIGYADGFSRAFSLGKGFVWINGTLAPVIGNVCMDMTMIDITGIDAKEGDEVIVFGKELPISEMAARINTIPYEILTSTSERVKRVFFAESI
jgi:Alr-MurF fusion protein